MHPTPMQRQVHIHIIIAAKVQRLNAPNRHQPAVRKPLKIQDDAFAAKDKIAKEILAGINFLPMEIDPRLTINNQHPVNSTILQREEKLALSGRVLE